MQQRSKHRSWFLCPCGHTFRSVTHRRRGLRKCPSCQLVAEHAHFVPPPATNVDEEAIKTAENRLIEAALGTVYARKRGGMSYTLSIALDALERAEEAYRTAAHAPTRRMTQAR